ncbi:MAG: DUF4125 family protein, partial [Oscillospiraceae bacterium]|nr:DUF4125 family protein [Oscillospiraceae bacterium]
LVAEKYIRMMRTTEPARYARLAANIPQPGERAETLARAINARLLAQTETLRARYPYVSGAGRPLRAAEDFAGVTSIETYQLGELLTYSERTLAALLAHVEDLEARGASLAEEILKNTVRFYGYESLERAETAQRVHAANQPGELSPGCAQ